MALIEGKGWTEQELNFWDHKLDTQRDTTLDGSRRCDYCYRGTDYDGDLAWMRCANPATVKIRVSHRFRTDTYEAVSCERCFARTQKEHVLDGYEKLTVVKIGDLHSN